MVLVVSLLAGIKGNYLLAYNTFHRTDACARHEDLLAAVGPVPNTTLAVCLGVRNL